MKPFVVAIGAFMLANLASAPVAAQHMSYAQAEFLNSCAPCHGKEGRGDGPLAEQLSRKPADLTVLERNNGGEFPFDRVFATIDGNFVVPAHGEREMPVWGRQFLFQDMDDFGEKVGRQVTGARIEELTRYVESLQR